MYLNREKGGRTLEQNHLWTGGAVLNQTRDAAFEQLMQTQMARVYRLCCWLVKDRTAAEDITQEVFLKAYKHLSAFRGDSRIETWLYRIAVNESKRYLRSGLFRKRFSVTQANREACADIETEVVQKDERAALSRLIDRLPFRHKQVLILHYYEELRAETIAEILGITPGAVYTRLHRAREKVKALMSKEEERWI